MSDPIRHHYLPQFYLEGFASQPVATPAKFWFFSFRDLKWHIRTPINTAVRRHYYTFEDKEKNKSFYIENYLAEMSHFGA